MNEPQKVTDPSQKYKIAIFLVFFVVAAWFGWAILSKLDKLNQRPLGFSIQEPSYSRVLATSVQCVNNTTGTVVTATSTSRLSFTASNGATSTINLCRNNICSATSSMALGATNTIPFVQTDAYTGPYSCWATAGGATTGPLLNVTYSNEN